MTKKNRRTWERGGLVSEQGWDSDVQNFTLTYSEALEASTEGVLLKIAVNGFMCGFPVCCVIAYLKRWYKFSKTGNPEDTRSPRFHYTPLGQIYSMCEAHDWVGKPLNREDMPSYYVGFD